MMKQKLRFNLRHNDAMRFFSAIRLERLFFPG
ncbi:hypothetical protein EPIR_1888 [Erwinia piriflorinigrans CFBP 5888]|uniref:Uncharacterized protein n=1 Tax=Erwinia piriflorinigrans CFBP 5888 TaxID=1161919 RepID=V5Z8H1_9GAMM|nr:hypothetical protein EPIR_1888 [Erwinia piriflorinigrans CFBP 5888]